MSTNTTFNESDHPRDEGGQFAPKDAPESEASLGDEPDEQALAEEAATKAVEAAGQLEDYRRPRTFVDREDELSDGQLDEYLAGDPDNEVLEEVEETFYDVNYDITEEFAANLVREQAELGDMDDPDGAWDMLDEDDKDRVRDAVRDQWVGDPVDELAKNRGNELLRHGGTFSDVLEAMESPTPYQNDGDEAYDAWASELTDRLWESRLSKVMDYSSCEDPAAAEAADRKALREAVDEQGTGYIHSETRLDLMWYGSVRDASVQDYRGASLEVAKPHLLMIDPFNGACYDTPLSGTGKVRTGANSAEGADGRWSTPADFNPVIADCAQGTYGSADSVCGYVKSAFASDVKRTPVREQS